MTGHFVPSPSPQFSRTTKPPTPRRNQEDSKTCHRYHSLRACQGSQRYKGVLRSVRRSQTFAHEKHWPLVTAPHRLHTVMVQPRTKLWPTNLVRVALVLGCCEPKKKGLVLVRGQSALVFPFFPCAVVPWFCSCSKGVRDSVAGESKVGAILLWQRRDVRVTTDFCLELWQRLTGSRQIHFRTLLQHDRDVKYGRIE